MRLTPRGLATWRRVLPRFTGALHAVERRVAMPLEEVDEALRAVGAAIELELALRSVHDAATG